MKERKQFTKEFKEGAQRLGRRAGAHDWGRGAESGHLAVDAVALDQSGEERGD